jgi:alcohol dehydrogenase class IV
MYEPESVWEFDVVDGLTFGTGAVEELPARLRSFDADSVLVITDEGLAATGVIDEVTGTLTDVRYETYAGVQPDPSRGVFEDAIDRARAVDPDAVVAVGGGSSIDVAKTTSLVLEHGGDLLDYVAPPVGEGRSVPGPGVPTVALPTTAGTGSETSPVSVISLPDRDLKVGISTPHQRPDHAIVDPLLTVSLPPEPTAASGIDALTHAIEAYTTRRYDLVERPDRPADRPDYGGRTPITDQFALRAIDLVGENLRHAVDQGTNVPARREMALASFMAGVAFTNAGLGAAHAMGMAVGAEHDVPHGVAVAAVLPATMRYNTPACAERYRRVAEALGYGDRRTSDREGARAAVTAVEELIDDVGLTDDLRDVGVTADALPDLVDRTATLERLLVGNPRRVDEAALEAMYRDAR